MLLSAALIVRDEARVLEGCLQSVRGVVDEIVVVDTGSTDSSPEIAARFDARVLHYRWNNDFAAARNVALDAANGDWILYIDADERLGGADRSAIERLLIGAPEVAFRLLLQPDQRSTPYREYRLWRQDERIRFAGQIHEKVTPAISAVARSDGRPIGDCDLLLTHLGYEGDQTHKHRRNLPLLEAQLAREPDNLFNRHHLARVLEGLGREGDAAAVLSDAVELARRRRFDPAGVLAFTDLVRLKFQRGEPYAELLAEARHRYPTNKLLWWWDASTRLGEGLYEDALASFDRLLAVDLALLPDEGPAYDRRIFGELAYEGRGACLFRLGRYAEAADSYAQAARLDPANLSYRTRQIAARGRAERKGTAAGGQ